MIVAIFAHSGLYGLLWMMSQGGAALVPRYRIASIQVAGRAYPVKSPPTLAASAT